MTESSLAEQLDPRKHPNSPHRPRETLSNRVLTAPATAKAMFDLVWPVDLRKLMINPMNEYLQDLKAGFTINYLDLLTFFTGLIIMMFMGFTSRKTYWNRRFSERFLPRHFTVDKFQKIFSAWRVIGKGGFDQNDTLWRVRPLMDRLNKQWVSLYTPPAVLSGDELCHELKGCRNSLRMYNGDKPHKWHIKEWAISCAVTGYIVWGDIYPGAVQNELVRQQHKPDKVLLRILPSRFDGKGYFFSCDNYFTSVSMVDELSRRG